MTYYDEFEAYQPKLMEPDLRNTALEASTKYGDLSVLSKERFHEMLSDAVRARLAEYNTIPGEAESSPEALRLKSEQDFATGVGIFVLEVMKLQGILPYQFEKELYQRIGDALTPKYWGDTPTFGGSDHDGLEE